MAQPTFTTALTLDDLEANHAISCKALRILVREDTPIERIQRSVCWRRLAPLQHASPGRG